MELNDFYLLLLAEECAEVTQRVSKSLRFGNNETQKGQELSNKERLSNELMDLLTIVDILKEKNLIDINAFNYHKEEKINKINEYLIYSQKQGKVQ